MSESKKYLRITLRAFLTVVAVLAPVAITPCRVNGQASGHVAPGQDHTITVFLKLHDQAGFDQAVADLYDQWFTDADFARYAPTQADMQTVKDELEKHGLRTVSIDPQNFSICVHGTVSAIENAFQTEIHTFTYKKTSFQAPRQEAKLTGAAGDLVAAAAGLERHTVRCTLIL